MAMKADPKATMEQVLDIERQHREHHLQVARQVFDIPGPNQQTSGIDIGPAVGKMKIESPYPQKVRSRVLDTAKEYINGDREQEYGTPQQNFANIAAMWQVLFPERQWTAGDVARAMAALKLARTMAGGKEDTYIDLAGYAALAAELS